MAQYFLNSEYESDERFDMARFMAYTDNFDPLTSRFLHDLSGLAHSGEYIVQNEEGRPEILSYKIYGNTQYWWILLYYNGITAVEDLTTNMVIKYPSIGDLENLYFSMKAKETSNT